MTYAMTDNLRILEESIETNNNLETDKLIVEDFRRNPFSSLVYSNSKKLLALTDEKTALSLLLRYGVNGLDRGYNYITTPLMKASSDRRINTVKSRCYCQ